MFKRLALGLLLALLATSASAQNTTCSNRPTGDSSNACANTRFVTTAVPIVTPSALTKTDDTNVTLTLTGTPATALLQAVQIAAGWNGQLSMARGGTSSSLTPSTGGIVWSGASGLAILSGTATARQMLQSGATASPAWSTATWPDTTAINQLLYSSSANVISGLGSGNSSALVSSNTGVPAWVALTDGQVIVGQTGGTPTARTLSSACSLAASGAMSCFSYNTLTLSSGLSCGAIAAASTVFTGIGTGCQSATEANWLTRVPPYPAVRDLRVYVSGAPGGVTTYIATLRKNGADTTLTCTITGVATSCDDTNGAHAVAYAAGDTMSMKIVSSAAAASLNAINSSVLAIMAYP